MKSPQVPPAGLSIDAAGAYIGGAGRNTVYSLLKAGELESFNVGARRFISRASCDALIERRSQPDYSVPASLSLARSTAAKTRRADK